MTPADKIKTLFEKANVDADAGMDRRILGEALDHLGNSRAPESAENRPGTWRKIMKSPFTKLAAAAAIVIAVSLSIMPFIGGSVTFADVIQPILNARTVVFDMVVGDEQAGPIMHDVVAGSRIRRTFSNIDTILILDLDNARMLTLSPATNSAVYVDTDGALNEGTRCFLSMVRNIVTKIQNDPDVTANELGKSDIDGTRAIGFQVADAGTDLTIWADAQTSLPVRIEFSRNDAAMILKNIEFDVQIDPSLLSMDIPEGYTLYDAAASMGEGTEEDFIATLKLWSQLLLDGSFPAELSTAEMINLTAPLGQAIDKLDISDETKISKGMQFGRALLFYQQLTAKGKCTYTGNGVELGAADKAVFTYQLEDGSRRTIYGDLSVKAATKD